MRVLGTVVLLLSVDVADALAQAGGPTARASDRTQLVEGVREIAAPGSPGSLAVYAPTASAVVTGGSDGGSDVAVVACGYLGKGRIVAFWHDGYFGKGSLEVADTARLLVNAARWAAGGKQNPRVGLIDGHELQPLLERQGAVAGPVSRDQGFQGIDVLVLTPYQLTPQQGNRLRAFARSGGGLLVAATGWGWQSGSKKPMTDFHGNHLLAGSGIAWTEGYANRTGPNGFLAGGAISPGVNAATSLDLLKGGSKPGPKDLACAMAGIRLALQVTPPADSKFRSEVRGRSAPSASPI